MKISNNMIHFNIPLIEYGFIMKEGQVFLHHHFAITMKLPTEIALITRKSVKQWSNICETFYTIVVGNVYHTMYL